MVLQNSGSAARRWNANTQEMKVLVGKEKLLYSGSNPGRSRTGVQKSTLKILLDHESFFCFLINLFIYLFLAVLGLRFCAWAFSSCGERGPLFITVRGPLCRGLSRCGAQAPDVQAQ